MFDSIKYGIATFLVKKKLKHKLQDRQSFKNFFKSSGRFLILMPENESHFYYALEILKFFELSGKSFSIFTHDYRVSMLPPKYHEAAIDFGVYEITRLNLPSAKLAKKLHKLEFSAVLDLNKEESLFNSLAANMVKADVRAGFTKNNSDFFYNLQVSNSDNNPDIFYKNFLNCLQMF